MAYLDLSQILNLVIALALVALPVEAGILLLINMIRRQLTDPQRRAELLSEAADQLWEPFRNPEQRAELIHEFASKLWEPMSTPESRGKLLTEIWSTSPLASPEQRQKLTL